MNHESGVVQCRDPRFESVAITLAIVTMIGVHTSDTYRADAGLLFLGAAGLILLLRARRLNREPQFLDVALRLGQLTVSVTALVLVDASQVNWLAFLPFGIVLVLLLGVSE